MSAAPLDLHERLAAARCDLVDVRNRAIQASRRLDLGAKSGLPVKGLRVLDAERLACKRELAAIEAEIRRLEAEIEGLCLHMGAPDAA